MVKQGPQYPEQIQLLIDIPKQHRIAALMSLPSHVYNKVAKHVASYHANESRCCLITKSCV